jgi:hypothetical protein
VALSDFCFTTGGGLLSDDRGDDILAFGDEGILAFSGELCFTADCGNGLLSLFGEDKLVSGTGDILATLDGADSGGSDFLELLRVRPPMVLGSDSSGLEMKKT